MYVLKLNCLNPCSNGISAEHPSSVSNSLVVLVLILVLMEYRQNASAPEALVVLNNVLILVLMEYRQNDKERDKIALCTLS